MGAGVDDRSKHRAAVAGGVGCAGDVLSSCRGVGADPVGRHGCMSFPVCPLWASLWLCGGFLQRGCTLYSAME